MISVIICSANQDRFQRVVENLKQTIGVRYELIEVRDDITAPGICAAYNRGGKAAKYPFLCFMHEDVLFDTFNWGELVCDHLSNSAIGLIGFAGGDTKSLVPSSWSIPFKSNEINIIQHSGSNSEGKKVEESIRAGNGSARKVAVLDGLWLCTRREVFEKFQFDEKTFTGFHGYDIDYSLQVSTKYELRVCFDIVAHHYSEGNPNHAWMESAFLVSKKWSRLLPKSIFPLTRDEFKSHHWKVLQVMLQHLFRLNYPFYLIVYSFLRFSFYPYFSFRKFLSLVKYIAVSTFK